MTMIADATATMQTPCLPMLNLSHENNTLLDLGRVPPKPKKARFADSHYHSTMAVPSDSGIFLPDLEDAPFTTMLHRSSTFMPVPRLSLKKRPAVVSPLDDMPEFSVSLSVRQAAPRTHCHTKSLDMPRRSEQTRAVLPTMTKHFRRKTAHARCA